MAPKKSHRAKGHKISAGKKLGKVTPLSVTASALTNALTTSVADPKLITVNQQTPISTSTPTGGNAKWDIATNKPS